MIRNTFRSFKGRTIEEGQRVKVYKNLNNGLWSIKDAKSGLVLGHSESVVLEGVKFSVGQKGRERVIKEQQKNVHAYVIGAYKGTHTQDNMYAYSHVGVTYNPYKDKSFTLKADRTQKLTKASKAVLSNESVFANIL